MDRPHVGLREEIEFPVTGPARILPIPVACDVTINWRADMFIGDKLYYGQTLFQYESQAIAEAISYCKAHNIMVLTWQEA